jgi:GNAT superfamily N-acetyltransferase
MMALMEVPITIRTGQLTDAPACLDLLARFYLEERLDTTTNQMTGPLHSLLAGESGVVLLACSAQRPVGLAIIATSLGVEQGGRVAEVSDLYVSPDFRGQGVGGLLLAACADWARKSDCRRLQLLVTPNGQAHGLVDFYREHAFCETGRTLLSRLL